MTMYVGLRQSNGLDAIIGPVSTLNQGMSQILRTACLSKGIKKTEQRRRLDFYTVTAEQYQRLTNQKHRLMNNLKGQKNVAPLVTIDADKMNQIIERFNSKPKFQGGMDRKTYRTYQTQLAKSLETCVQVTGKDQNIRKKAKQIGDNPYRVGDMLQKAYYRGMDVKRQVANLRVIWSGKRMIEVEYLAPKDAEFGYWPNTESVIQCFRDVTHWGLNEHNKMPWSGSAHGHFVPLKNNETELQWYSFKKRIGITDRFRTRRFQWTEFADHDYKTDQYKSLKAPKTAEIGYYYNDNGCND